MTINFSIPLEHFKKVAHIFNRVSWIKACFLLSLLLSAGSTAYFFQEGTLIAYGDAESHLNISKRVIHSLTPGLAQLGGIWLPLPHLLMVPFVYIDYLWRTGLAGAIVSGICFIISSIYIYKTSFLLLNNKTASLVAYLVFVTNPNILYMQSTPMTELPLILFFVLSSYYFLLWLKNTDDILALIKAGLWGLCASLSRYDGWFLVAVQSVLVCVANFAFDNNLTQWRQITWEKFKHTFYKAEGQTILFTTLAFAGIVFWLSWDWIILGDPLYFTSSQFSAKSQQQGWLAKKQLPAYHDLIESVKYYTVTSMSASGILLFGVAISGLILFIKDKTDPKKYFILPLLMVPYMFYVLTLFMGQSLIFIPHITPITFEWTLFNVRYGVMMISIVAIFVAYCFHYVKSFGKIVILSLCCAQLGLYIIGYSKVIAYDDGTIGLSSNKNPDAQFWLAKNYDSGLVLMDDYKRIFSLIRTNIPMQKVIYIGNKPYWEESLKNPELYAKWIIIQKDDTMWKTFYETTDKQGRLYKYYEKVYTSDDILIFKLSSQYRTKPL